MIGMPPRFVFEAVAIAIAAGVAGWKGYAAGSAAVQQQWTEAASEGQRLVRQARDANADRAHSAAEQHQKRLVQLSNSLETARHDLRTSVLAPIRCPEGVSTPLGDVLVPAAALDSLRRAAGDPPGSAASGPPAR